MKTYSFEGKVTAVTSILHNGGEQNGIATQLRREKVVMPNGEIEKIPVISGNAVRGILRDVGMYDMVQQLGYGIEKDGKIQGLSLNAFYFLFSGGSLTSEGGSGLKVDKFRKMKELIPLIGVFGGAMGNQIMPGKVKIGKLIPIASETNHLLPDKYKSPEAPSVWDICQTEMYTRRDDEKNDKLRDTIEENVRLLLSGGGNKLEIAQSSTAQQMMYRVESIAAGTMFYWRIILEDPTDLEFESFIQTLLVFSRAPYIGGRSAVGHGEISVKFDNWIEIDSRANLEGKEVDRPLLQKYQEHLKSRKSEIIEALEEFK